MSKSEEDTEGVPISEYKFDKASYTDIRKFDPTRLSRDNYERDYLSGAQHELIRCGLWTQQYIDPDTGCYDDIPLASVRVGVKDRICPNVILRTTTKDVPVKPDDEYSSLSLKDYQAVAYNQTQKTIISNLIVLYKTGKKDEADAILPGFSEKYGKQLDDGVSYIEGKKIIVNDMELGKKIAQDVDDDFVKICPSFIKDTANMWQSTRAENNVTQELNLTKEQFYAVLTGAFPGYNYQGKAAEYQDYYYGKVDNLLANQHDQGLDLSHESMKKEIQNDFMMTQKVKNNLSNMQENTNQYSARDGDDNNHSQVLLGCLRNLRGGRVAD